MTDLRHKTDLEHRTWLEREEGGNSGKPDSVERRLRAKLIFFVPDCSRAQKKLASIIDRYKVKPIDANSLQLKLKNYTNCAFIVSLLYSYIWPSSTMIRRICPSSTMMRFIWPSSTMMRLIWPSSTMIFFAPGVPTPTKASKRNSNAAMFPNFCSTKDINIHFRPKNSYETFAT